ncbi:MAG: hypothetical protein CVT89_04585, partial [Candidatus Altiarchaeales archaeon HGW-Altiarchaeales-2]
GQMTLLEEDLEKIKADKEKAKMKEKYEEVKTKLSGKKHRFTLDEMRILMGAGGEIGISEKATQ